MEDGVGDNKRYYPQEAEQNILTANIAKYFSYAERSPERSSLASEISEQLQQISSHWTRRAVRLWFNNNKNILSQVQQVSAENKDNVIEPKQPVQNKTSSYQQLNQLASQQQQQRATTVHFAPTFTVTQPNTSLPVIQLQMPMASQHSIQLPWAREAAGSEYNYGMQLAKLIESAEAGMMMDKSIQVASSFDSICNQMHSKGINLALEGTKTFSNINFPSRKEQLPSFSNGPPRPPSTDPHGSLWQARAHQTTNIPAFDATYNGGDGTMYIHCVQTGPERVVTALDDGKWNSTRIGVSVNIESCAGNDKFCFALSNSSAVVVNLVKRTALPEVRLIKYNSGSSMVALASASTAIAGLTNSSSIFHITSDSKVSIIDTAESTSNNGIASIGCVNRNSQDGIIVCYTQSPTARILAIDGRPIRYLIGHTESIIFLSSYKDQILTVSDDKTAKLWDIRSSLPVLSLSADKKSLHGCSLSSRLAVLSTYDRSICVFDCRAVRPYLGIVTDDYAGESLYFNEQNDEFTMFGIASKDGINDSILFLDDNMQNTKYVYRKYAPFISKLIL